MTDRQITQAGSLRDHYSEPQAPSLTSLNSAVEAESRDHDSDSVVLAASESKARIHCQVVSLLLCAGSPAPPPFRLRMPGDAAFKFKLVSSP